MFWVSVAYIVMSNYLIVVKIILHFRSFQFYLIQFNQTSEVELIIINTYCLGDQVLACKRYPALYGQNLCTVMDVTGV